MGRRGLVSGFVILIALSTSLRASDQSWSGYIIDVACARDRKNNLSNLGPEHTHKCLEMPACQNSGYALLTDELKVLRFDARGNDLAKKLLEKDRWRAGAKIRVDGNCEGDLLLVKQLKCCSRKQPLQSRGR